MTIVGKRPFLVIVIAILILILPALIAGPGKGSGDLIYHIPWLKNFSEQLWDGILYPRWLNKAEAGCGYPIFFVYPPLPYYIGSLFVLFKNLQPEWWLPLVLMATIAIIISAVFCYLWFRTFASKMAATLATVCYLFLPYNIFILYKFFSPSSLFAAALLPPLLYYTHKIAKDEKWGLIGLSVITFLILMSSISGVILIFPLSFAYFLYLTYRSNFTFKLVKYFISLLLGTAMAAVFVLPLLIHKNYVILGATKILISTPYSYSDNFLFPFRGERSLLANVPEMGMATLIAAAVCMILIIRIKKFRQDTGKWNQALFWFATAIIALFMMYPLSSFVWKMVPLLQNLQMPMRISIVFDIAIAAMVAIFLTSTETTPYKNKALVSFFATLLFLQGMFFGGSIEEIERYRAKNEHDFQIFMERLKNFQKLEIDPSNGALPMTVNNGNIKVLDMDLYDRMVGDCSVRLKTISGNAGTNLIEWVPRHISFEYDSAEDSVVRVSQLFYPGWKAINKSTGENFSLKAGEVTGLIDISLPQGKYIVELVLEKDWSEQAGIIISGISFLLVFSLIIYRISKGSRA